MCITCVLRSTTVRYSFILSNLLILIKCTPLLITQPCVIIVFMYGIIKMKIKKNLDPEISKGVDGWVCKTIPLLSPTPSIHI